MYPDLEQNLLTKRYFKSVPGPAQWNSPPCLSATPSLDPLLNKPSQILPLPAPQCVSPSLSVSLFRFNFSCLLHTSFSVNCCLDQCRSFGVAFKVSLHTRGCLCTLWACTCVCVSVRVSLCVCARIRACVRECVAVNVEL